MRFPNSSLLAAEAWCRSSLIPLHGPPARFPRSDFNSLRFGGLGLAGRPIRVIHELCARRSDTSKGLELVASNLRTRSSRTSGRDRRDLGRKGSLRRREGNQSVALFREAEELVSTSLLLCVTQIRVTIHATIILSCEELLDKSEFEDQLLELFRFVERFGYEIAVFEREGSLDELRQ